MTERWGPDPEGAPLAALFADGPIASIPELVAATRRVATAVGAPVQALAADRVLSWTHLLMAEAHARRARGSGRARADDPSVEFVLYAAADRQIGRALDAVGVRPGPEVPMCFVALGQVEARRMQDAVASEGLGTLTQWRPGLPRAEPPTASRARLWWAARLHRPPDAALGDVEDALLGVMAVLATAKP